MHPFTRREFLKTAPLVAGSARLTAKPWPPSLAPGPRERPPRPHLIFPTAPRERLAVSTWPFRAFMESPTNRGRDRRQPGMDLKAFPSMVAERFNVPNIEPLAEHFASTDPAYLTALREAVEKAGSHIVDIPVSTRYSFYDSDLAGRERAIDVGKHWIGIAVAAGSPSIRIHIAGVHGVEPDVDRAAASLRRLADEGAAKNVIVNLENDDLVTEDAFFLVQVIQKAHHPYLHALPDFCNSMMSGNADFDYRAMNALFPLAYNIAHMKDSEMDDRGKVYTIDVSRTFAIAKSHGYRGYFSMEWEGKGEPYAGTQRLIDESLKCLA